MRDHRPNERGFTLIELIVSLGLGAIVTLTLFTLTAGSGRIFHEQQRVAHTQLALRNAVERIRADFARAGFLATPHSSFDPNVCPPGAAADCPAPPFQGIAVTNVGAFVHLPAVNTLSNPDTVDLFGAFDDSNVYFSQTLGAGTMTIDPNTASFQQRFGGAAGAQLTALLDETFTPGEKILRIHCPGDPVVFQAITGAAVPGPPLQVPYGVLRGVDYDPSSIGMRCEVSTASLVRYQVQNVCGDVDFATTCRTGGEPEKMDLVRAVLDPETGAPLAGTSRIVAEYAVDFDVRFDVDTAPVPPAGTVGNPVFGSPAAGVWTNGPICAIPGALSPVGRVRAAQFRLSVRTRDEDPGFPFAGPGVAPVVQRFEVDAAQLGAARVRSMTTKVELSTFASLNIQNPGLGAGCP